MKVDQQNEEIDKFEIFKKKLKLYKKKVEKLQKICGLKDKEVHKLHRDNSKLKNFMKNNKQRVFKMATETKNQRLSNVYNKNFKNFGYSKYFDTKGLNFANNIKSLKNLMDFKKKRKSSKTKEDIISSLVMLKRRNLRFSKSLTSFNRFLK